MEKFTETNELHYISWGKIHGQALNNIKDTLRNAFRLSYSKREHVFCIFTDVPDKFWAGIVT